jgi:hypothetical protein
MTDKETTAILLFAIYFIGFFIGYLKGRIEKKKQKQKQKLIISSGQLIDLFHKNGLCNGAKVYRNGVLADTNNKWEHLIIDIDGG